jgi:hypothetical protein
LNKINSTIIQWRTYLDSVLDDDMMIDEAKVDDFVAMVEHTKTLYSEGGGGGGGGKETPKQKL